MTNEHIAFENIDVVAPDEKIKGRVRPGYDYTNVHIIFDINTDNNFTREEILVNS